MFIGPVQCMLTEKDHIAKVVSVSSGWFRLLWSKIVHLYSIQVSACVLLAMLLHLALYWQEITMDKHHVLVDAPSSKRCKVAGTTNWELCVLCQEDTGVALQCPVNSLRSPIGNGYISLGWWPVQKFQELLRSLNIVH